MKSKQLNVEYGHCMRCHDDYDGDLTSHNCPNKEVPPTGCPATCKNKRFYLPKLVFGDGPSHIQNHHKTKGKAKKPLTWQEQLPNVVRGALKSAQDAHPELNNYNGLGGSVEKRLVGGLKSFINVLLDEPR
jgi:hypothetical protein